MNRAAYILARTMHATHLSAAPIRAPVHLLQPTAYLRTSAVLLGEPMKKKKKQDPQDAQLKMSKRAKKFEKAIKKLEKLGRRMKLVDEIEGTRKLRLEVAMRKRDSASESQTEASAASSEEKQAKSVSSGNEARKAETEEAAKTNESEKSVKRALKKKKKAEKAAEEDALAKQSEVRSNVVRLSEAEQERRALLHKSWTRYQSQLTAQDDAQLTAQLRSVDRALSELKLTNLALYERAIEVDPATLKNAVEDETVVSAKTDVARKAPERSSDSFSILPFDGCGPTLTRSWPSSMYEAPDGEYIDITRNYELGVDVSIYVRSSAQQKVVAKTADDGDDN